jgi:uncharacterized membrane protein YeaQ/YmgE (transglycosylase-associated protein family)
MFDQNKTFVIYVALGLIGGLIIGLILGFLLDNFALWLSLIPLIGALIGLAVFYYLKDRL